MELGKADAASKELSVDYVRLANGWRCWRSATLTMQALTTIELDPADVCADCGARLLEEWEVKDRA